MISSQESRTRGLLFHGISSMLGDLARGVIKSNSRVKNSVLAHEKEEEKKLNAAKAKEEVAAAQAAKAKAGGTSGGGQEPVGSTAVPTGVAPRASGTSANTPRPIWSTGLVSSKSLADGARAANAQSHTPLS